MHVSDRAAAMKLWSQERVSVQLYGQWNTFIIIRRKNNPASPQVDFGLMYQVPGKD
jgi:hypothetical protein